MISAGFDPTQRLSCADCGHTYDPEAGDTGGAVPPGTGGAVPPGTAFARLPHVWRCPGCGAPQHRFAGPAVSADPARERVVALVEAYQQIAATDMKGLPVCNPNLSVEAVEFRPFGNAMLGVLIAPWTLNVVLLPNDPGCYEDLGDGDKVSQTMPSATYGFTVASLGALGRVAAIPAVSDMNVLRDQDDARHAALAALEALLTPARPAPEPAAEQPPEPAKPPVSRRALFRGRGA